MTLTIEEKTAWAARLRTRDFKQISGDLTDGCKGRCVLGVLVEVLGTPLVNQRSEQWHYDVLIQRDVSLLHFWHQNDTERKSFAELANEIDATPIDDPVFNSSWLPKTPDTLADH